MRQTGEMGNDRGEHNEAKVKIKMVETGGLK